MDYTLAKELEENGFNQVGKGDYLFGHIESDNTGIITTNSVYIPTLEELIDAMTDFPTTHFCLYGRDSGRWEATEVGLSILEHDRTLARKSFTEIGKTPKEAIARLWLSTHKHSTVEKK